MNVLIVLKHGRVSGVNTFARALSILLKRVGFKVYFNVISEPTKYFSYITEHRFDYYQHGIELVACFHNYATLYDFYAKFSKVNVFVTHGTQCADYVPPSTANRVFCLSHQQYDYYKVKRKILFPNLIEIKNDTSFLPARRELKKVLLCDIRYGHFYQDKIKEACGYLGLEFDYVGKDETNTDIFNRMNEYDLIVGYGRCILEALSIGKCVIVYGINGGDGYMASEDFDKFAYKNFSGYSNRSMLPPARMEPIDFYKEFVKYNYLDGLNMKGIVIENYSIKKELERVYERSSQ